MLFKKVGFYISLVAIIITLSACGGTAHEVKIYDQLEEAVQLEAGFEEQQDKIVALENQEQKLFEEISALESSEADQIKKLSEKAIESIEEREEVVKLEGESIADSREAFEKAKTFIDELEEQDVKEKAEEMYETMIDRYESYDQLHEAYLLSLEEERNLYTLLQKEDVTQEEFSEQVTVINEVYEQVIQGHDKMNEATKAYNVLKKEFYDVAELNVSSEKD